jgi:hypothetical protein
MSIIKQLGKLDKELSKKEIEEIAIEDIKAVVEQDKYDLLKVLIELKRYNVYINTLISELKEPALEKAKEIDEKKFKYENAKVWITKRVSFDYSNDKIWSQLHDNMIDVKSKLKEHQELLKQLDSETTEIIDEETGEVIEVTPPIKKEESGLMIRI